MFPILQIEAFFRSKVDGLWLDDEFPAIASLCEQWLLSFKGDSEPSDGYLGRKPAGQALDALNAQDSDYPNEQRLRFAVAMALCTPNEKTGDLFVAYRDFIDQDSFELGDEVRDISGRIRSHSKVDVYKAFTALPGREYYSIARNAYMTELEHVRRQAFLRDDVGVFKWSLPEENKHSAVVGFSALLEFPLDPESKIYQSLITDENAEKALFRRQISQLRMIAGDVDDKYGWLRPEQDDIPILEPWLDPTYTPATAESFKAIHRDPHFARNLHRDTYQVTDSFFDKLDENLRIHTDPVIVKEVTRAFVDAGVSAEYIISYGMLGKLEGSEVATPAEALTAYGELGPFNRAFYGPAYLEYLKQFTPEQIIEACINDEALSAIYGLTRDKRYLEAGASYARDKCFESDLGL